MFTTEGAYSGFAVSDIVAAQDFYGETLGLVVEAMDIEGMGIMLVLRLDSGADVLVYEKPDHAPANFTILNFPVEDIDAAVDELQSRNIEFLRYEGFDQDEKGIARGTPNVAWFADPSGNIIAVMDDPES